MGFSLLIASPSAPQVSFFSIAVTGEREKKDKERKRKRERERERREEEEEEERERERETKREIKRRIKRKRNIKIRERERTEEREREKEKEKIAFGQGLPTVSALEKFAASVSPENKPIKGNWALSWSIAFEIVDKLFFSI